MDTVVAKDRPNMTEAEWQSRCDLAALYRICDLYGWTDTINTHLSVRVPGEPKCFLINNYGDLFGEITASSLVKMDIDGNVYSKNGAFNAAGFTIHSGVYKARPDANCVILPITNVVTPITPSATVPQAMNSPIVPPVASLMVLKAFRASSNSPSSRWKVSHSSTDKNLRQLKLGLQL